MRGYGRASNDPVLFSWRGGSLSHIVREGLVDRGGKNDKYDDPTTDLENRTSNFDSLHIS